MVKIQSEALTVLIAKEKNWLAKCRLISLYHNTQQTIHGKKRLSKWRVSDTARELDKSSGFVSESLKLNKLAVEYKLNLATNREHALKMLKMFGR